ncbi:MAG: UDP-glucose--hexose-1-phosphate uridylyltransferase [Eubacteriales bacterium]|nr:UDP-glucose--hexose-1-phosphate uridylyltransferase [Eubacteriales bacterium]
MNVWEAIQELVNYGIRTELITEDDGIFVANHLLDAMKLEATADFCVGETEAKPLEETLKVLLDDAVERGVIEEGIASRDLFDTKLMGFLTPRPSEVIRRFKELYKESPKAATDYFYKLSQDSDYIRSYRIRKDRKWVAPTKYGDLDITINLSKPEKDPKAIAAALTKKQDSYPKCLLCPENQGYAGRLDHPARQNIRLIPLTLDGEKWFMQYSPYVYYNEHCIVLSGTHTPMKIEKATFARLMEFIKTFPHYTVGSNADLPIVGGSILTHEHFQGGHYTFAMEKAPVREKIAFRGFEDVEAGIVKWPMSVIRLDGTDSDRIVELADRILTAWRGYSDEEAEILAETDKTPHNTITPIARMRGEKFELDLVLRNNRTTEEHPLGLFHPHQELHHIKKENIGLIEVMGLAVLPARLLGEIALMKETILAGKDASQVEEISAHGEWLKEVLDKYPEFAPENVASADPARLDEVLETEIGVVFSQVLEHAGVFKDHKEGQKAFRKFVESVQ